MAIFGVPVSILREDKHVRLPIESVRITAGFEHVVASGSDTLSSIRGDHVFIRQCCSIFHED